MTPDAPDKVLEFLGTTKGWHDAGNIAERTGYGVNVILRVIPKLYREHYIEQRSPDAPELQRVYSISYDGIEFRKTGGYAGKARATVIERRLKRAEFWALTLGGAFAGLYSLKELGVWLWAIAHSLH